MRNLFRCNCVLRHIKGPLITKAHGNKLLWQRFCSLFLYRRWYRCHVALEGFALDGGAIERRRGVMPVEFSACKKLVLLSDLMDDWPAAKTWSLDQLVEKCGDAEFKVKQPYGKDAPMKMKDFAGYMDVQRDEEPLYI